MLLFDTNLFCQANILQWYKRKSCNQFIVMCRRYTTYKTVVILQLVKLGYMFRPLPDHHQANREILLIKVHSLALININ